mmetsp:Transcript_14182/g.49861  ORF Transcript_14182/g.49861 Transcript_14182/m.49861 type:complete len:82 (-) Transcript_14182:108-353(-)
MHYLMFVHRLWALHVYLLFVLPYVASPSFLQFWFGNWAVQCVADCLAKRLIHMLLSSHCLWEVVPWVASGPSLLLLGSRCL